MSDTPETEKVKAALHTNWHDLLNHARKLERERDEARDILRAVIKTGKRLERERDEARDKYATEATDHMLAVNKLCNERDEAQADCLEQARLLGMGSEREARLISERDEAVEEIKEWKTLCLWGGTPEHIHGFIRGQQSRIQHLECERDEAMELLASEKITRNHIIKRSVEVEQERDEARESTLRIDVLNFKLRKELDDAKSKIKSQADRIRYLEGATNHACGTPLSVALRERDEARNNIEGWENKWRCAVDMAARAELERDDALDDAKEYHIKMVGLINERNDAREDAKLLSERLTALELQSTAELARLEQELINIKELHESNN